MRAALASLAGWLCIVLAGCGEGKGGDAAAVAQPYLPAQDTVRVTGGTVQASGDSTAQLRVFRAMPFAAPPVGQLRWKAPQAVVAWNGVRRADSFAAGCVTGNRPFGQPGSILYQNSETQSEDCLYLNVWSGAAAGSTEKRPVMVLLHGGALLLGSGAQPNYDGTGLAQKGAIVVTLNYRLGALGFLAHPGLSAESPDRVSGNYGLLDTIAALRWVAANIASFGGDPANVTVYSESAGAQLASVLLASPLAKGLFHRAVLESLASFPAGADTATLATAEVAGTALAANLGAPDIAALRALLPQQIMAGTGSVVGVIVDGYALPDQLDKLYARGAFHDVPLLTGWNADEGTPYPLFATTLATYRSTAAQRYGSFAEAFARTYPVQSDADVLAMAHAPMRDGMFGWQPWTLARAHAAHAASPTWLYHFMRRPSYFPTQHFTELDPPGRYGAHHTLEQVYFYNNLDRSAPLRAWSDVDRRIADVASSYLVNFAVTGDPNRGPHAQAALPAWPAFGGAGHQVTPQAMLIGDAIEPGPVPQQAALAFFDAFYAGTLGRPLPFALP
ncbi:MAG TPA: carboxylesterase family protein [Pseudoduganella sp.]|jgi:para-nitrobenzyl esterase